MIESPMLSRESQAIASVRSLDEPRMMLLPILLSLGSLERSSPDRGACRRG